MCTMRTVPQSIQLLQQMQANGLQWMQLVRSREQVVQAMHFYLTRAEMDISAFPPVIHIAGTKGKGSTASFTESMLRRSGLKTALFTSPHLVHVSERFRLDGKPVSEDVYLRHFYSLWEKLESVALSPVPRLHPAHAFPQMPESGCVSVSMPANPMASPPPLPGFNFLTLLAFKLFMAENVDVVIFETGLGGRLDATNILGPSTVAVCGITTLDFEHTETLGETMPQIAAEKAGIFKPGVPAVTVLQRSDAMSVLSDAASACGTPLFVCDPSLLSRRTGTGCAPELGMEGRFQLGNAALATALVDIFLHQQGCGRPSHDFMNPESGGAEGGLRRRRRASSFDDTFGASIEHKPVIGKSACPVPTYDKATPLPAWAAEGLKCARWPGRAQLLHVHAHTGKAVDMKGASGEAPSMRLFVEGAHTARSMIEAAAWFSSSSHGSARPRILIFTCGADKDIVSLFLPLSVMPWDLVLFAGVEWSLTRRAAAVTPGTALDSFLHRRRCMGDLQAIEDVQDGIQESVAARGDSTQPAKEDTKAGLAPDGPPRPLAWQHTLSEVMQGVYYGAEYRRLRQRMEPVARGDAAAVLDVLQGAERVRWGGGALPPCPPMRVVSSFEAAMEAIRHAFPSSDSSNTPDVLVTGSLYLVGAALQRTGAAID